MIKYVRSFHKNRKGRIQGLKKKTLKYWYIVKKRFYNRETITTLNYKIQQMTFNTPLPFYATQIINPFLNHSDWIKFNS